MSSKSIFAVWLAAVAIVFSPEAHAEIKLPKVFGSHMVLQQDKPIVIWGWASPNETVTVELATEKVEVQANAQGEWKATLSSLKTGGPYTLKISGSSTVTFDDVLVGEVWLCSGQSNMEMGMTMINHAKEDIADATNANIRLFLVKHKIAAVSEDDCEGTWRICSPEAVAMDSWGGFSATAYFFGKNLQTVLKVPVGLIESSWGGTRIEPWTPPEGFASVPALKNEYDKVLLADPRTEEHRQRLQQTIDETRRWLSSAEDASSHRNLVPAMPVYPSELLPPHEVQNATALFNGMIHPLIPFAIRGAIWYQGESNLGDGAFYTERMKALIAGWRTLWGEGEFPFYFVQIAPYNYGNNPETEAEFWVAQTAAQSIPNTGMAVINDIGDVKDIHPKNKQEVGRRLALWALSKTYNQSIPVFTGPAFQTMKTEHDKLRLTFDSVGNGLKTRDGNPPDWFQIIDADEGGFVKADAQIDGASVILSAPTVKDPVAVRYAWSMLAEPNLQNSEGLPASAFRAGDVPKRDLLYRDVPEAKDYQLVYDLDLSKLGPVITYDADNHDKIQQPFDRVAYCVELGNDDGGMTFIYVSMDAFTSEIGKIGIPTVQSGASFQRNVTHLNIWSNAKGIVSGTDLSGGNIEFWPNNYGQGNAAGVPNASPSVYDFGDEISGPPDGYGSMQVHNHDARQTLFAINHWREGRNADIGIGNQATGQPDWTFSGNAGKWNIKRLRVLVHLKNPN